MFVVIARYRLKVKYHTTFVQESRSFFEKQMKRAVGFHRLLFLRNILDPEYVDVVTEWDDRKAFMEFISDTHTWHSPFSVPHEVRERYLYESI